jgi:hypothetical protein
VKLAAVREQCEPQDVVVVAASELQDVDVTLVGGVSFAM